MLATTESGKFTQAVLPLGPGWARESLATISLSEIISAMSFALDLTEDAVPGHSLRTCLLGMRLADEIGLPQNLRTSLYYALLLKDIGCSSNAARMCAIVGGDDRLLKAGAKLEDWTKPHRPTLSAIRLLWREAIPGSGIFAKMMRMARIGLTQHRNNKEMIQLRCDRGAEIVRKLGMGDLTAEAVHGLDEHWDGRGYPLGRAGEAIPILSRISLVAQHLDVFASERGTDQAMRVLEQRSGYWFDPTLVQAARTLYQRKTLFTQCGPRDSVEDTREAVIALDPGTHDQLPASRIDLICEAFADVVDAKSPFTFHHSVGVAEIAVGIARNLYLPEERIQLVRRAALLHDIGKLRVPNSILDKQGTLTRQEWKTIREHPELSRQILERIPAFREVAVVAGEHHEKLDGTGYPHRLLAVEISIESRIIAVADIYCALSEQRPYRRSLSPDEALRMMVDEVPAKLDRACFEALVLSLNSPSAHLLSNAVN